MKAQAASAGLARSPGFTEFCRRLSVVKEILPVSATRKASAEFKKSAPLFAPLRKLRAASAKVSGRIA